VYTVHYYCRQQLIIQFESKLQASWQVVSLPQYHFQTSEGIGLLTQTIAYKQGTNATAGTLQISWMSLSANSTSVILPEIAVKSYLEGEGEGGWVGGGKGKL
jgi:hypothetical protein